MRSVMARGTRRYRAGVSAVWLTITIDAASDAGWYQW